MNKRTFQTGEIAMMEAKRVNPDCGSIVYMKEEEFVTEFVDGTIQTIKELEIEKERLIKNNSLFSQIGTMREQKENLTKQQIERLFKLIDGLETIIASEFLKK